MKKLWLVLAVFVLIIGLVPVVHAQPVDTAALSLIEATTPTAAADVPETGNFYSAQNPDWAPSPADVVNVPAWDIGGGFWLLDDLDYDYSAPTTESLGRRSMSLMDDLEGDDLTPAFTFPTNSLWLQITNVANGLAYVNLMNATDSVYEIWSKTDLTLTNWTIEQEVWPMDTNCMPFIVQESDRTNLFLWARDWTGITSNGNTTQEWWFWKYFGTVDLSDTNLDSTGENTLLDDYEDNIDPNPIEFSLQFTNTHVNTSYAYGTIVIQGGMPASMAMLVNTNDFTNAIWQPYDSNIAVPLTSGDGNYDVWVGVRGLPADASQSWQWVPLTLDTVPPVLTITNPTPGTVSQPMIQLQGFANESLASLTFDVSNAAGVFTNQTGFLTGQFSDTNLFAFTTNYFQCYDIALTNGLNQITLHATDLAGNQTTTNANFTLDYSSDHTAPVLSVLWPTNGTSISGSNFTLQAQMDDPTATVTASVNGNTVQGLVEQNGSVWVNNLMLNTGTNAVTLTATDAAGNSSVTNFNVIGTDVGLTVNPLTSDQMNQYSVSVSGSVGSSNDVVTINGVSATVNDDGTWEADSVPVNPADNASLNVQVSDSGGNPLAARTLIQSQPSLVQVTGWRYQFNQTDVAVHYCDGSVDDISDSAFGSWDIGVGGFDEDGDFLPTNDPPVVPWSYGSTYDASYNGNELSDGACGGRQSQSIIIAQNTQTALQLVAGGAVGSGVQRLIRLTVAVLSGDVNVPLSAINLLGQVPSPTATNAAVGEVWVSLPAGSVRAATPMVTGFNSYTADIKANDVQLISQCVATMPSNQSRTNLGVGEQVNLSFNPPLLTNVAWNATGGSLAVTSGTTNQFTAPDNATNVKVTATIGNVPVNFFFKVFAPTGYASAQIYGTISAYQTNQAGAGVTNIIWMGPTNVSFNRVWFEEVGEVATNATGYFANTNTWPADRLDHGQHGANNWFQLPSGNVFGDIANSGVCDPPWTNGNFTWPIPVAWQVGSASSSMTNYITGWNQNFTIDASGTVTVQKFGISVTRTTNGVITTIP